MLKRDLLLIQFPPFLCCWCLGFQLSILLASLRFTFPFSSAKKLRKFTADHSFKQIIFVFVNHLSVITTTECQKRVNLKAVPRISFSFIEPTKLQKHLIDTGQEHKNINSSLRFISCLLIFFLILKLVSEQPNNLASECLLFFFSTGSLLCVALKLIFFLRSIQLRFFV